MPLMKSCAGCGRLIPFGKSRCPECEEQHIKELQTRKKRSKREADRRYNRKRDPKYKKFYNSREWTALSQMTMRDHNYTCDWCGKKAGSRREDGSIVVLEVDHIEEVQTDTGWHKRFDKNNLRVLCTICHNKRHDRFQPRPQGVGQKV